MFEARRSLDGLRQLQHNRPRMQKQSFNLLKSFIAYKNPDLARFAHVADCCPGARKILKSGWEVGRMSPGVADHITLGIAAGAGRVAVHVAVEVSAGARRIGGCARGGSLSCGAQNSGTPPDMTINNRKSEAGMAGGRGSG